MVFGGGVSAYSNLRESRRVYQKPICIVVYPSIIYCSVPLHLLNVTLGDDYGFPILILSNDKYYRNYSTIISVACNSAFVIRTVPDTTTCSSRVILYT